MRNFFQPISTEPIVHRNELKDLTKTTIQAARISTESKEIITDRLKVPTFWEIVEDERTSSALKAFAIKRNVSAWKEKFAAKTLSPVYETAILSSFNDTACISKLMNARQFISRTMPSISEFNSRNEPHDPTYSAKLIERFIHVRKMQNLNDKSDMSSAQEITPQTNDISLMDLSVEPSQAFIPFYDEIESKYEEVNDSVPKMFVDLKSPVQLKRTPLKSSTPFTSKKTANKIVGSIKDSPLVRAFEKCKSLNKSKRKRKKSTLAEALAFLGLNDAMDIFGDSLEEADCKVTEECLAASNHEKSIVNKRIETASTTSGLNHQASQEYTVSQILKIVNVSSKDLDRETSENHNSSVKDKSFGKEIYIGTIDEIFGSNDNVEIDNKVPSEKQSASEEEDVIASSQPVISEIKLPSKHLSNTENKRTPNHPEFPSSGEDMFSSFSKINSPIASHSNNLPSNVPSIHPTTDVDHNVVSNIPFGVTLPKASTDCKSSPSKNSTLQTVDRSPSVFRRKINLTRLKALSLKFNSERLPSNNVQSKSPLFFSCNNLDVKYGQQNDEIQSNLNGEPSDNGSQIGELTHYFLRILFLFL